MARCSWLAAHGSLPATRSRRTTSRKNNCVRDLRESWVSFTVLTDDRSPRIGCPVFQLLTDPPRLFPPDAGLFRLACASHVAFEGFLIPCSGFGGSSVSSLETSFLLSSGCLPSARVWTWSTEIPLRNEVALHPFDSPPAKFQVVLLQAANVRVSHHHQTGVVVSHIACDS
jgi:hypothetical protein